MNDLVFKGQNDQVITTSLKVAEKFKKEHRNVLKSIRKLMTAKNVAVAKMFDEQMYVNDQGKEQPMFYMNRDGFTLLAMGFTGDKAIDFKVEYINAFNTMEAELKSQQTKQLSAAESLLQSVQLLVAHEQEIARLKAQNENLSKVNGMLMEQMFDVSMAVDDINSRLNNEIDLYTVIGYCSLHKINITRREAAIIGGACARMCKKENIHTESIADPRFGKVNTYPSEIIAKCYENRQKKLVEQTI